MVDPVKRVLFLRELALHPQKKIKDVVKEVGIGKSQGYNFASEFVKLWGMTNDEENFPDKLVYIYNRELPEDVPILSREEILSLKWVVDKATNQYGDDPQIVEDTDIHKETDNTTRRMEDKNEPDLSTNELLMKNILQAQRYIQPQHIEKFLQTFRMLEEDFMLNPDKLLDYMRHMFGPSAGENAFNAFRMAAPKFIADPKTAMNGGMNPMLIAAMMQGGDMNSILPMLMQGGGIDSNTMLMLALMGKGNGKEKDKEREDAKFEKLMQIKMLDMLNASTSSRQPMDIGAGGNSQYQVQEVLDSNGQVKQRNLVPFIPQMGVMGQQSGQDAVTQMVLKSTLDANNMLQQQILKSNEPIRDIFMSLIPNFKTNADPIDMISRWKNAFPETFNPPKQENNTNIELVKLKTDTDLALAAHNLQLEQLRHSWHMEEVDRTTSQENANKWMEMLGGMGEKIAAPLAQAFMSGAAQKFLGGGQKQASQQEQIAMRKARDQSMRAQAVTEDAQAEMIRARQMEKQLQEQAEQQQPNPAIPMIIAQLQQQNQALANQVEQYRQEMIRLSKQSKQKPMELDAKKVSAIPTDDLKSFYEEYMMRKKRDDKLVSMIENEISNREFLGNKPNVIEYDEGEPNKEVKQPVRQPVIEEEVEYEDELEMEPELDKETIEKMESGTDESYGIDSQTVKEAEHEIQPRHTTDMPVSVNEEEVKED
jgi:hypothetical protein